MENPKLVRFISDITKKDIALLYYFPEEIEKAIKEGRLVLIQEDGKIAAFAFWHFFGDWVELATMYVSPEFRGRGYLRKLIDGIRVKISGVSQLAPLSGASSKSKNIRPFLFTQVPQVIHVAEEIGFKQTPHSILPPSVSIRILLHRCHPRRWLSYLKHIKNISRIFKTKLYISLNYETSISRLFSEF